MSLYLSARCGKIQILIDIERVMEVMDFPDDRSSLQHINWRDQLIRAVDFSSYLGQEKPTEHRLIVVDTDLSEVDQKYIALDVESCEQLLQLEKNRISDIGQFNDQLIPAFSGVYIPENSNDCQLILRFPAQWLEQIQA